MFDDYSAEERAHLMAVEERREEEKRLERRQEEAFWAGHVVTVRENELAGEWGCCWCHRTVGAEMDFCDEECEDEMRSEIQSAADPHAHSGCADCTGVTNADFFDADAFNASRVP